MAFGNVSVRVVLTGRRRLHYKRELRIRLLKLDQIQSTGERGAVRTPNRHGESREWGYRPAASGGHHRRMTDAQGPGSHVMYQDFTVAAPIPVATLIFDVFIGN